MSAYLLTFDFAGDRHGPLAIEGDSPAALAQAVHRHARGYLGGRRVDVHLDEETLTGAVVNHGQPTGQFRLAVTQPPAPTPHHPMHGYTAADIDRLARTALVADRWRAGDTEERYAAIRFAIVEHLCTTADAPSRRELVGIGLRASDRHVMREMHHHGWDVDNIAAGSRAMLGYQRWWQSSPTASPERAVVERQALNQIWPQLTPRQQQSLEALRDTGDYQAAADAMGIAPGTYRTLISQARRRFYDWWHEGETPSTIWRTDKHLYARSQDWRGKPRLTVSQVEELRDRYHGGETVTALAAEVEVHKSTLSALFTGRTKPAPDPVGVAA